MTSSSPPARAAQDFGSSASSKLRKGKKAGTSVSEQMVGEIFCHRLCLLLQGKDAEPLLYPSKVGCALSVPIFYPKLLWSEMPCV